jgi:hypothetical protein
MIPLVLGSKHVVEVTSEVEKRNCCVDGIIVKLITIHTQQDANRHSIKVVLMRAYVYKYVRKYFLINGAQQFLRSRQSVSYQKFRNIL